MTKFNIPKRAPVALMSHLVAGFPTDELALVAARALVAGGAAILEIQLPFSDPSADGPAIQGACSTVLSRGYRTADGFAFIKKIHAEFSDVPILIMTYGSLVYTPGVEKFCALAKDAGASGLIVPDLPFDCDEGLTAACTAHGLVNIPVAAPSMTAERLSKLANAGFPYIYAALRAGTTGQKTVIAQDTIDFLKAVSAGGSEVFGGFGISSGEQAKTLSPHVAAVVAGSVFVRIIAETSGDVADALVNTSAYSKSNSALADVLADKTANSETSETLAKKITEKASEISCLIN